eukprot:scaffold55153_cov112-Phaeocystis_antarctica.AAC.1
MCSDCIEETGSSLVYPAACVAPCRLDVSSCSSARAVCIAASRREQAMERTRRRVALPRRCSVAVCGVRATRGPAPAGMLPRRASGGRDVAADDAQATIAHAPGSRALDSEARDPGCEGTRVSQGLWMAVLGRQP